MAKLIPTKNSTSWEHYNQIFFVCMKPDEFLEQSYEQSLSDYKKLGREPPIIDKYDFPKSPFTKEIANKIENEEEMEIPFLDTENCAKVDYKTPKPHDIIITKEKCQVVGHEGRNRALVSKELGVEEIPVLVSVKPLKNWPWDMELLRDNIDKQGQLLKYAEIDARPVSRDVARKGCNINE